VSHAIKTTLKSLDKAQIMSLQLPDSVAGQLASILLPTSFLGGRFRLAGQLEVTLNRSAVVFGRAGLARICLETNTGKVIALVGPRSVKRFVNSTLKAFGDTCEAVSELFPFHPSGSSREAMRTGSDKVASVVRWIDPPAMGRDRFWSTLVDDIQMGSFDPSEIKLV
jgi:SUKH-4 immunity protein